MQESLSHAFQEFQEVWPSLVCAVVFLLLLLWDVFIALKRRAHWVPGHALVLTALTIQMLGSIAAMSDISYSGSKDERNHQVADLVKKHQLLFDCGRLMMCVFIGYLLPSMVSSNWTQAWSNIGGLILTILFRLAFEVYFVWRIPDRRQSSWFAVSNTTLFMASTVLSLLLSSAVLAGKSIRSILLGKVHWALSCCPTDTGSTPTPHHGPTSTSNSPSTPECKNSCCPTDTGSTPTPPHGPTSTSNSPSTPECKNSCCSNSGGPCKNWCCSENLNKCANTQDHVLKCWIVARVSQPEYIMARSVFSSLAGVIVTIGVVIMVVKWACIQLPLDYGIAHKITVFIEFAFILVGWMVISFRWLTAVIYFPRRVEFLKNLEDFWTQSIVDLQADLDAQLACRLYKDKIVKQRKPEQRVILDLITAVRLHSVLLPLRVWLQILMVSLSKACWGLSQMSFGMLRHFIVSPQQRWLYSSSWRQEMCPQFFKVKKALDVIRMPGEMACDLWTANEMAFKRIEGKMEQGIKNCGDSEKLIKLIRQHPELKKEDRNNSLDRMSWKRRGVSLLYCMIHLYEDTNHFDAINVATRDNIINKDIKEAVDTAYRTASDINDAVEACSDAWDLLDFVDSSGNVLADKEFEDLRNMWQKHFRNLKELIETIEHQLESLVDHRNQSAQHGATGAPENWHGSLENWHGSKDWMNLTVCCNLYKKLHKHFHLDKKTAENGDTSLQHKLLQHKLANVILDCLLNELDKVLIKKCNEWAEEGNEEEIYSAAFIAGKAKELRAQIFSVKENDHYNSGGEAVTMSAESPYSQR